MTSSSTTTTSPAATTPAPDPTDTPTARRRLACACGRNTPTGCCERFYPVPIVTCARQCLTAIDQLDAPLAYQRVQQIIAENLPHRRQVIQLCEWVVLHHVFLGLPRRLTHRCHDADYQAAPPPHPAATDEESTRRLTEALDHSTLLYQDTSLYSLPRLDVRPGRYLLDVSDADVLVVAYCVLDELHRTRNCWLDSSAFLDPTAEIEDVTRSTADEPVTTAETG